MIRQRSVDLETMRSKLLELRVPHEIKERLLNHKLPDLIGTYDRWQFIDEKREALEAWARHLQSLPHHTGAELANPTQSRTVPTKAPDTMLARQTRYRPPGTHVLRLPRVDLHHGSHFSA